MLPWFAVTLFVSALLLFLVQPMIGKMVLPLYGGTPAVWNGCMVFFQAALLVGYAYAHASVKWLGVRRQSRLHLLVLLVPLLFLPVYISADTAPPPDGSPVYWLLMQLCIYVGLPFFVVSTTAPLLQRWFASTRHRWANDPYFLYAASNGGSLLALLGYPLLCEPFLDLSQQSRVWSCAYGLLVLMILCCAVFVWRRGATSAPAAEVAGHLDTEPTLRPSTRTKCFWVFCAFVPSSLMLSATMHITTNLAAVPLLWVLPLSTYLLTFILVFARRQLLPHKLMVRIMPWVVILLGVLFTKSVRGMEWALIPGHLMMLFIAAMVCHGELARTRPGARHLTEFYLWMSVGGVLGGVFNALIAPLIFTQVLEYPLAMVLACLVLPRLRQEPDRPRIRWQDVALPLGLAVVMFAGAKLIAATPIQGILAFGLLFGPAALVCFSFKDRPVRFALAYAVVLGVVAYHSRLQEGTPLYAVRNFFGVKRVALHSEGQLLRLYHGTTVHGSQIIRPQRSTEPLTYYHPSGPIGDLFRIFNDPDTKPNVALLGQGAGSIAYYAHPGQQFTYYEIDPQVNAIAQDRTFFTFMSDSQGRCEVVLGDGRLTLADAPDHHFGIIVLDAFSSDAIPVHLLTREAVAMYLSKLAEGGVLAFHVSNRFLDLEPLLGQLAAELRLSTRVRRDLNVATELEARGKTASHYVVMGPKSDRLRQLAALPGWEQTRMDPELRVWTDKYTNLLGIWKWK